MAVRYTLNCHSGFWAALAQYTGGATEHFLRLSVHCSPGRNCRTRRPRSGHRLFHSQVTGMRSDLFFCLFWSAFSRGTLAALASCLSTAGFAWCMERRNDFSSRGLSFSKLQQILPDCQIWPPCGTVYASTALHQ